MRPILEKPGENCQDSLGHLRPIYPQPPRLVRGIQPVREMDSSVARAKNVCNEDTAMMRRKKDEARIPSLEAVGPQRLLGKARDQSIRVECRASAAGGKAEGPPAMLP
jgi:hypothetical protein